MSRLVVTCLLWAVATGAAAEMSESLRSWADSPVQLLLSRDELRQFRSLRNDADAERFIELFWARRDPEPATPANELRESFGDRVAAADEQFGYEGMRGAFTDRGRALILLGAPDRRTSQAAVATLGASGRHEAPGGADIWTYERATLPLPIPASQLHLVFRESRPSRGDFTLDRTSPDNRLAIKVLADAPAGLVTRPALDEPPAAGLLAGAPPASAAELELLGRQVWPADAWAVAVPGIPVGDVTPAWVHVRLPPAAPAAERLVGRVRRAGGDEVAGTFSAPAKGEEVPGGTAYELAIPLAPGSWRLELALLAAGEPLAVRALDLVAEPVPAGQPWISPLYWGGEVREQREAALGAPFNVGGWRVVPRPEDAYQPSGSLEVFGVVVAPPVVAGQAAVELSLTLRRDGTQIQATPPETVALSRVRGDVWMHGRSIPLSGLARPGAYALEVIVREPGSGIARSTSIPLHMRTPTHQPAPAGTPPAPPGTSSQR